MNGSVAVKRTFVARMSKSDAGGGKWADLPRMKRIMESTRNDRDICGSSRSSRIVIASVVICTWHVWPLWREIRSITSGEYHMKYAASLNIGAA